ncbi:MAG: nicotinate-nucleotide adenylyltransferase [Candidatus Obscuribacterales bacterium]|nr:nicotinate-nucleotide adenylyltransferase [Candidatus Obscuribacterales bacterium]
MRQIGLFCGTFNPVHMGHLIIAECARDQFKLEKVLFVTSPAPPHRADALLDGNSRHEMVHAATGENPFFVASNIELERTGPSYTIDTVKQVRTIYGDDSRINLIIGGDNLGHLHSWKSVDELLALCRILVVPRLRYIDESDKALRMVGEESFDTNIGFDQADIVMVDFPGIAVSGSNIRQRIADGKSVLYMVPPAVNDLIVKQQYFKSPIISQEQTISS